MARRVPEAGITNIVAAVRSAGRPVSASDLVGKPYAQRSRISWLLNEAERRGLVRGSRVPQASRHGDRVLWEVCDG